MELWLIETIILIAINAFGVFLIIIVLANSSQERLYRWFALMTFFLLGWVDFAHLGFSQASIADATTFYRINGVFVSGFIFAAYVFYIDTFLKIKREKVKLFMLFACVVFGVLSLFGSTIIQSVIHRDWGNEIVFGPLNPLFSAFTAIFSMVLMYRFASAYFTLPKEEKRKVAYFLLATLLLIAFNVVFNVLSPAVLNTARYQHLGDYSAIFYLALTAFAMVQRKFLNVKVALTAFLISVIGILLVIDTLALSDTILEQGMKALMLIFFVAISILLVRSVLKEIEQREQLKQLAQEQKDIIDVMGHEIRTPLTVIVQELKLHERVTLEEQAEWESGKMGAEKVQLLFDSIRSMSRASMQAVSVVNDMLETARLDKGKFELNYETFDLVEEVRISVELMAKTVDQEEHPFTFNAPDKLDITADKVRVREAVDALLSNAVKYGFNNSTGKWTVSITITASGDFAYIAIKDTGRGILPEDIKKLGQKFTRLNPKTSNFTRPGGTGLGLFVVKGILDKHGGDLQIESEGLDKGSTFTIKLPLKPQSPVETNEQLDSTPQDGGTNQ